MQRDCATRCRPKARWMKVLSATALLSELTLIGIPAPSLAAVSVSPPRSKSTLLSLSSLPPATAATLTYCDPGGNGLKMDFYRPTGWGVVPVVLQVHGGGWRINNRAVNVTVGLVSRFLKKGIAFATIDYRLGDARLAIADVTCAVRYLRASARHLGINPSRIGAMGQSAGAQLVSLLGTSGPHAGFDVGQYPDQSSRVEAVADEWGPIIFDARLLKKMTYIPLVFGTSDLAALREYSPVTYLTKDDPPFLLVHGAKDSKVPIYQSKHFAAALKHAGIREHLIVVQRAGHYLIPVRGTPTPSRSRIEDDLAAFFAAHLRK